MTSASVWNCSREGFFITLSFEITILSKSNLFALVTRIGTIELGKILPNKSMSLTPLSFFFNYNNYSGFNRSFVRKLF
ncbi:MAG: hypothetical protein ACTSQ6_11035 [Candidatus Heimdallarchaeaceae archaeon]